MANISVYGYDTSMLDSLTIRPPHSNSPPPPTSPLSSPNIPASASPPSTSSPLLLLPPELRLQILAYILPHTYTDPLKGLTWFHSSIAPLSTCTQLRHECLSLLYSNGSNTFSLLVNSKNVYFVQQWYIPSTGYFGHSTGPWQPRSAAYRHAQRIGRWNVDLHSVDDYEGMVFHGKSSVEALAWQVRGHVERLCRRLDGGSDDDDNETEHHRKRMGDLDWEAEADERRLVPYLKINFCGHKRGTGQPLWRWLIIEPLVELQRKGKLRLDVGDDLGGLARRKYLYWELDDRVKQQKEAEREAEARRDGEEPST